MSLRDVVVLIAAAVLVAAPAWAVDASRKLNVLFLMSDDLRPDLGCY